MRPIGVFHTVSTEEDAGSDEDDTEAEEVAAADSTAGGVAVDSGEADMRAEASG